MSDNDNIIQYLSKSLTSMLRIIRISPVSPVFLFQVLNWFASSSTRHESLNCSGTRWKIEVILPCLQTEVVCWIPKSCDLRAESSVWSRCRVSLLPSQKYPQMGNSKASNGCFSRCGFLSFLASACHVLKCVAASFVETKEIIVPISITPKTKWN